MGHVLKSFHPCVLRATCFSGSERHTSGLRPEQMAKEAVQAESGAAKTCAGGTASLQQLLCTIE